MSSLQDVLTGPNSKVSALEADTRSYDPPPGLVRPGKECEATELAKVRIPPQFGACKCVMSSAIVIAVGSLPSTSPTDVLSINTGSGSGTILIGMPWTFLAALLLPAGAPAPIRLFPFGKARELSPLPFRTQLLIEGNCPHPQQAARNPFALSPKTATLPGTSCLVDTYAWTRVRYPPLQGILFGPSPLK